MSARGASAATATRSSAATAPRVAARPATRSGSTARAPRRVERQRPARPQLRVAPHAERVRKIRPTAVLMAFLAAGIVFGALSIQISLIHRQQQLDAIRQRVSDIQEQNKELRQRESRLQAPSEILRIARDDLGMVESKPAELVTPEQQTVGPASDQPAGALPAQPVEPGEG